MPMTSSTWWNDDAVCTCNSSFFRDHGAHCQLQQYEGWRTEEYVWSPTLKVLVKSEDFHEDTEFFLPDEDLAKLSEELLETLVPADIIDTPQSESAAAADDDEIEDDDEEIEDAIHWSQDLYDNAYMEAYLGIALHGSQPSTPTPATPTAAEQEEAAKFQKGCTCDPSPDIFKDHPKSCDVWKNPDWVSRKCEWDPKPKDGSKPGLRWYWSDEMDGTGKIPTRKLRPEKDSPALKGHVNAEGHYIGGSTYGSTTSYTKDRHYQQEVTLVDGTVILCSSNHTRKLGETIPDFGLYMDGCWSRPDCLTTLLPWTDHGLPKIRWDHAAATIVEHFNMAKSGLAIEIGCIGGHGRTGTVLACFAVLAGTPATEACQWVWDNYCDHAIESKKQEWFVEWFDAHVNGRSVAPFCEELFGPGNPKPPPPPPKKYEPKVSSGQTSFGFVKTTKDGATTVHTPAAAAKANTEKMHFTCRHCGHNAHVANTYACNNAQCRNYKILLKTPKGQRELRKAVRKEQMRKEVNH